MGQVRETNSTKHIPTTPPQEAAPAQRVPILLSAGLLEEKIIFHPVSWLKSKYLHVLERHHSHSAEKHEAESDFEGAVKRHLSAASEAEECREKKAELFCAAALLEKLGRHDEAVQAYVKAFRLEAQSLEACGILEQAAFLRFDIAIFSSDRAVKKEEFARAADLFTRLRWHIRAGQAHLAALRLEENFEDKIHLAHLIADHYGKERAHKEMAGIWLDLSYESQNPRISRRMFVLAGICMMKAWDYSTAMDYFLIALRDETNLGHRLDLLMKIGECLVNKGHWREAGLCFAAVYHHLDDSKDFIKKWNLAHRIDYCFRHAGLARYSEESTSSILATFKKPEEKSEMERLGLLQNAGSAFRQVAEGENYDFERTEPPPLARKVA